MRRQIAGAVGVGLGNVEEAQALRLFIRQHYLRPGKLLAPGMRRLAFMVLGRTRRDR